MKDLLKEFLSENVVIVTDGKIAVESEEGVQDLPVCVEGTLIDYDPTFILLEDSEMRPTLVSISHIIKIDLYEVVQELGPPKSEMN